MLALLQTGNSLIQIYRGLFLAEDATTPNIWNLEHCRLFSLLHYYNNFNIQSLLWHLQFASWNKQEQDLVLTELITSVLYFHYSEGSNAHGLAFPQIQFESNFMWSKCWFYWGTWQQKIQGQRKRDKTVSPIKLTRKEKYLNLPLQLAIQTQTPTSLYSFIICNRVKLRLNVDISHKHRSSGRHKPITVQAAQFTFPSAQLKLAELQN